MPKLVSQDGKTSNEHLLLRQDPAGTSYSATSFTTITPPPTFEEAMGTTQAGTFPQDFEYEEFENGDIVSEDPRISRDPEALYQFLMAHCKSQPSYRLRCIGETLRTPDNAELTPRMVKDFDFTIAIPTLDVNPVHWSLPDNEPGYRGQDYPEVMLRPYLRQASDDEETEEHMMFVQERTNRGLPPWSGRIQSLDIEDPEHCSTQRSTLSLREWIDEYCCSKNPFKQFAFEKVPYGWDLRHLENSLVSVIRSTRYRGRITVSFSVHGSNVLVRQKMSKFQVARQALNTPLVLRTLRIFLCSFVALIIAWLVVYNTHLSFDSVCLDNSTSCADYHHPLYLWIPAIICASSLAILVILCCAVAIPATMIHPANSSWQVCGAAYPMYRWIPVTPDSPEAKVFKHYPEGSFCDPEHTIVRTAKSVSRLVGMGEEHWHRTWEGAIRKAIARKFVSDKPLYKVEELEC